MQALASARRQEQDQYELAFCNAIAARLNLTAPQRDKSEWPTFKTWCKDKAVTPYPARPGIVAFFILDNVLLGIERLLAVVESIAAIHEGVGVADPTVSPLVSAALDQVAPIQPPRSWPKEQKALFLGLPRILQVYVAAHEADREKVVRRALNQAGDARREPAAIQQPEKVTTNGKTDTIATSAA
jgi:hypothetical protein